MAVRGHLDIQRATKAETHGRFFWKGQLFSAEGVLLVDLDNIAILPLKEPLPSSAELSFLRSTSLLSTLEADKTAQQIEQARIKIGDRVKVVSGPYLHLIGVIKGTKENEVSVYVPLQGTTTDMSKDTVRTYFLVGNGVRVIDGQHRGLLGWVVAILANTLRVLDFNVKNQIEVGTLYCRYAMLGLLDVRSTSQSPMSSSMIKIITLVYGLDKTM